MATAQLDLVCVVYSRKFYYFYHLSITHYVNVIFFEGRVPVVLESHKIVLISQIQVTPQHIPQLDLAHMPSPLSAQVFLDCIMKN